MAHTHPLKSLRGRQFSLLCTLLLVAVMASLGGADTRTTVIAWVVTSALMLVLWQRTERLLLQLAGCRPLSLRDRDLLKTALEGLEDEVFILDSSAPWIVRGLRTTVVGSGLLDLVQDRQLRALLLHAALFDRSTIGAELVVWIGIVPLWAAWHVNRWIGQAGRLLAILVGATLVVPLLIWPSGFLRWGGRLLAAMLGGMLSSLVLTSGMTLLGVLLMTSWALVPAMRALLAWESRRAERAADDAVVQAGLGWELVGAFDELLFIDPPAVPPGLVTLLTRAGSPIRDRLDRVWRALSSEAKEVPKV